MSNEISPPLYMDAVIQPNRSLSARGMWIVLGVFAVFNLWVAAFLYLIGAWPVPIFLGLDFVGVLIAFRIYRGFAATTERVRVDADRIVVSHETARRRLTVWTSSTAFTRVGFDGEAEHGARLFLHLSGRSVQIGQALGSGERVRLAERLNRAIADALAERHT